MSKYTLENKSFPALAKIHQGTGAHSGSAHVVDPPSVNRDVSSPLKFRFAGYKIRVMSLEIDTTDAPNWFGVSFREGLGSFDTVNIFCHPHPGNAGMRDTDYATRSGEWPKLFRYAEIFGRQMSIAQANHITIIPFFNNASYGSTGIFGPNWNDIVEQILALARSEASVPLPSAGSEGPRRHLAETPVEILKIRSHIVGRLKQVVLSDFSYGRTLMWAVRSRSPGLKSFLREVWDFDGVHAAPPLGILYDQGHGPVGNSKIFHVPPERWQEYHHAILKPHQLHGDIPAMLACHAATISTAR